MRNDSYILVLNKRKTLIYIWYPQNNNEVVEQYLKGKIIKKSKVAIDYII